MGRYGHSRIHELLPGSATDRVLHRSPFPLLIAHYITDAPATVPLFSRRGIDGRQGRGTNSVIGCSNKRIRAEGAAGR
jgi:hypothetical protein